MAKSAAKSGRIYTGIGGWTFEPWRGVFYPEGLAQKRELQFASRMLPTIELNGSFYSLQRPECYAAWYADTPPGCVFAVKGGRYITHMLRLKGVDTALASRIASLYGTNVVYGSTLRDLEATLRSLETQVPISPLVTAALTGRVRFEEVRRAGAGWKRQTVGCSLAL